MMERRKSSNSSIPWAVASSADDVTGTLHQRGDPFSGEGARLFGGRWNPPDVATVYLASSIGACVREFLRMAEGQGRGPDSFLPRDLHEFEVSDVRLLDLTNDEALESVRITIGDIGSTDLSLCQDIGRTGHFLGMQGVRAPSATGVGEVLALFDSRITPGQIQLQRTLAMDRFLP